MILAETLEERKAALAKLLPYQREDFAGIFRALKGYPATIRFLDPPLHEFLPHTQGAAGGAGEEDRRAGRARSTSASSSCTSSTRCSASAAAASASAIPRSRRCRRAPCSRPRPIVQKEGIKVQPEIMIPLVGFKKELDLQIEVVHQAAREVQAEQKVKLELHGRHDDRDPARRAHRRRDRAVGRVLQLRHQRPDADRPRHVARRLGLVPAALRRSSRS